MELKLDTLQNVTGPQRNEDDTLDWFTKICELGINVEVIPRGLSDETYAELYERVKSLDFSGDFFAESWQLTALLGNTDYYTDLILLMNKNTDTLAHYAAWSGKPEALDWIKTNVPQLLAVKNNNGFTIAHAAALGGKPEALNWIKTNAPQFFVVKNNIGITIAHAAACYGKPEALDWIKTHAPQLLELKLNDGQTIAHAAALAGKPEALDWIKTNAPQLLELKTNCRQTIAHAAAQSKEPRALETLDWVKTHAPQLLNVKGQTLSTIPRKYLRYNVLEWIIINLPNGITLEAKADLAQHAARYGSVELLNIVLSQIESSEQITISINDANTKKTIIDTLAAYPVTIAG